MPRYDAIVVGAGPNGLSAAAELARAGRDVLVVEAKPEIGGGASTAELTLPGFHHDVGSAVHPLAIGSPFFRTLPLAQHGLEWIHPDAPLAHPLDDGTAVVLERSVARTMDGLGTDGRAWAEQFAPFAAAWDELAPEILAPLRRPERPILLARFGLHALGSGRSIVERSFDGERARALFAGVAAHSNLPLERLPSGAFGFVLTVAAHAVGWPIPRGGAESITRALTAYVRSLGGEIETGRRVTSLDELPAARSVLLDLTPRQVVTVAGDRLPERYRRALGRFRYGPGAFKMDWALAAPIPWTAPECARAATVHVGGRTGEIAASESAAWNGRVPDRPFLILTQPSLFDPTRAPEGRHIAWAYAHVPSGSDPDLADAVEAQIERFAPGFRDRILARSVMGPRDLERANPNLIGGDIGGGANVLGQLFFRPTMRWNPYRTPVDGLYLCSSATPPGAGVHGMCGYHAARTVLRDRA